MALKIFFMGTPEFSVPILKSLSDSEHEVAQVYTQPPKKKNRGQKLSFTPIYEFAKKNRINIRYPEKLDTNEEINFIKKKRPDVVIVVAYGKILPSELLNLKDILFINIHASLLPKWRGAAPIQRSIMNLDKETGISIMKIVPKLDAGPVMMKKNVQISEKTNFSSLSNELSKLGANMILKSLQLIEQNEEVFIEQNEHEATYANKIKKEESKINWNDEAKKIIAKINALNPNPGCWFKYDKTRIKIIKAVEVKEKGKPGYIISDQFVVGCSENAIQILELQKEGKKSISVSDFLKGNKIKIGSNVK